MIDQRWRKSSGESLTSVTAEVTCTTSQSIDLLLTICHLRLWFRWTRSSEYKDFQTDDDLTIEQTTSPKKQADEDLVARPRAALTPEELRSLDTKEDEPYGEASYQSIPKPHPPHEMDSGECSRVLNQTAIWASPISPSSSGPPDPPVSENPEELTSQSITEAETVARVADQHVIGAEKERFVNCSAAEADEAQGDPLADLDERASTLLEQCRQLLAAPSANSGQVGSVYHMM